jgi:NADH:ubiquinone oxidoreductase subunit B-like Fe-S oxidoreductase
MLKSDIKEISMLNNNNFMHTVNVVVVWLASQSIEVWQAAAAIGCSVVATVATVWFQYARLRLDRERFNMDFDRRDKENDHG